MRFVRIHAGDRPRFQERLADFDAHWSYPYGSDRFRLYHGPDYYAFFDRLGDVYAYAFLDGEVIAGMGIAVLRRVPYVDGGKRRRTWYLCDAKAHPGYRGQRLTFRAAGKRFLRHYLRCPRAYGVSMNPGDGSENYVTRYARKYRLARMEVAGQLGIFSFGEEAMREVAPLLVRHRGPVSYLSLKDKKDLIMDSTGSRLPLLHAQYGPCAEQGLPEPQPGHTHMFCALLEDDLTRDLRSQGIEPDATASIIAHRMRDCDWRFILTSDI